MTRRRTIGTEPPADRPGEQADPEQVVRTILLRKLSSAPRTRGELEQGLARRGADPDIASAVLDRFEEVGLIDDEAFANAWVDSRHASRGLGRRALRFELARKGLSDEIIDRALARICSEDEYVRAHDLARNKVRPGIDPVAQIRRLSGLLERKGYSSSLALRVARDVVASDDRVEVP